MDYVKISQWVEKVIKSCQTIEQLYSAERLLELYNSQTKNQEYLHIHTYLYKIFNNKLQTLK